MKVLTHRLAGEPVTIHVPERRGDLDGLEAFLARGDIVLGLDAWASGADPYAPGHRLFTVTFASARAAWVVRCDLFADAVRHALRRPRRFAASGTEHLLTIDRHLGVRLEEMAARTFDTRILGHLVDPTGVDSGHPRPATSVIGWQSVDDDANVRAAGERAMLAARRFDALGRHVHRLGLSELSGLEHRVQTVLARMQRRGFLVDAPYLEALRGELLRAAKRYHRIAAGHGVRNPHSGPQVRSALAGLDRAQARRLEDAVLRVRRDERWLKVYVQKFLELRDGDDRLHPRMRGLGARTGRMAVSHPSLQNVPKDWRIRRGLIADPGHRIVSFDFAQIEMRVLAALAEDQPMISAIRSGVDLHAVTAQHVFGPGFTPAQREIAKQIGFAQVYGGGLDSIVEATGADAKAVAAARDAYDAAFPGVRRFSERLRAEAKSGEVVLPRGTRVPIEPDRAYATTNYVVQSTAADVFKQAMLRAAEAGLGKYLLLPVHDELIAQAPTAEAGDVARALADVMTTIFRDVPIVGTARTGGAVLGVAVRRAGRGPSTLVRPTRHLRKEAWRRGPVTTKKPRCIINYKSVEPELSTRNCVVAS